MPMREGTGERREVMGELSHADRAQRVTALHQAWIEEWGDWPSPACSRAFGSTPLVQELAEAVDGCERVGSTDVALMIVAEVLTHVDESLGREVADLRERAAELTEEVSTLLDLADERETDLLERLRTLEQAPASAGAGCRPQERSGDRFQVGLERLLDRPSALDWLRALRTLRLEAARVRNGESPPEAIAEMVGAALARGCSAGRASVALEVPVATVQRVRPRCSLSGEKLLDVEQSHRDTLLRGFVFHQELGEGDFEPEKRVLNLKTVAGPDLGIPTYRSSFAKGHK
jgi:hypothetical protein